MATMPAAVPRRPHVALSLRLPPQLHTRLVEAAEQEHRSLTSLVIHVLAQWLAQRDRGRSPGEYPPLAEREYPRVAEGEGPPYRPGGV